MEYYGPNGEKHTYMTQHELAEWAHSMNPEGPGKPFKQYEWRIPNEYLKLFPDGFSVEWEEQPTMVGEVIPLDWCTHNPDVNGVFLRLVPKKSTQNGVVSIGGASAPVKWEIAPDIVIRFKDERIDEAERRMNHGSSRILWTMFRRNQNWRLFTNPDDIISTFKHFLESGCPPELFQQWEKEFCEKLVPYADVLPFCSCRSRPCELPSDMVSDCFNVHSELERYLTGDCRDFVAYNGVRANFGSNHYSRPCFTFLLLCGSERPDSDVSREFIRHMPVSVDCAITEINRIIGPHFLRIPTNRWDHNDNSVSEWQEFLGQHSWIQEISVSITENGIRREIPIKNLSSFVDNSATNIADGDSIAIYQLEMDVLDTLVFAVLCDKYGISISSDSSSFIIRKSKVHSNIPLFSPGIFVLPKDDAEYRWAHVSRMNKRYNVRHPRSQWLLDNAKNLHKELPDIFNRIIRAMACIDDHQEIITAVNTCLQQIQRYNGNKFKVTERLFINEDDFE